MDTQRIRQISNAIGCVVGIIVSLFLFVSLASKVGSLPPPVGARLKVSSDAR
jgi:hypothetical protein